MNRWAVTCGVIAAVTFWLESRALAGPKEVLVVPSAHRCVDADALARAIHRDTSLTVQVAKREVLERISREGVPEAAGRVVVEVKGQNEELTVELRGADIQVSQPVRASSCETTSDVVAAFVASVLAPPPAIVVPPLETRRAPVPPEKDGFVAQRAALMLDDLDSEVRARWSPVSIRIIGAVAFATLSTLSFVEAANTQETHRYLWGAGYGVMAVGHVATFMAPDDYTHSIRNVSPLLGLGLLTLGLDRTSAESGFSPYAEVGLSGAFFLEGALLAAGDVIRRPVSRETLAAHYESIRTPEQRSALTADQLARIEADFRRSESPLPRWVLAAPLLAGGSVALGAAFVDARSSDLSRALEGLAGAGLIAWGALTLFPQSGYFHYQKLLEQNGLRASVQGTPGRGISLQVQGTF